jgi:hypothetical protein
LAATELVPNTKATAFYSNYIADMEKLPGDSEGLAESSGKAVEKEAEGASTTKDPTSVEVTEPKDHAPMEAVPDPDEDDLDDLDGQLYANLRVHILTTSRYAR